MIVAAGIVAAAIIAAAILLSVAIGDVSSALLRLVTQHPPRNPDLEAELGAALRRGLHDDAAAPVLDFRRRRPARPTQEDPTA